MLQSLTDFKSIREQSFDSDICCYFVIMNIVNGNVTSAKTLCLTMWTTNFPGEQAWQFSVKGDYF